MSFKSKFFNIKFDCRLTNADKDKGYLVLGFFIPSLDQFLMSVSAQSETLFDYRKSLKISCLNPWQSIHNNIFFMKAMYGYSMTVRLFIGCLLVCFMMGCETLKANDTELAAKTAGPPDIKYLNGSQACAVLESFINSPSAPETDQEFFDSKAADPNFIFYGKDTSRNTDCTFTDGTVMTWQDMRNKNVSQVCFSPDYSAATLLVSPSYYTVEKFHFKNEQNSWRLIAKSSADHVLVDGGYLAAKRGYKTNSYFKCYFA